MSTPLLSIENDLLEVGDKCQLFWFEHVYLLHGICRPSMASKHKHRYRPHRLTF